MQTEPDIASTTRTAYPDDAPSEAPPAYPTAATSTSKVAAPSVQHQNQFRDPLFAILFLAQFFAVLVIGWYCYGHDAGASFANNGNSSGSASLATGATWGSWTILAIICVLALLIAYAFLALTKAQPKFMIWCALIYMCVMSLFGLVLAVRNGSVVGIIFAVISFALTLWFVYCVRSRIGQSHITAQSPHQSSISSPVPQACV